MGLTGLGALFFWRYKMPNTVAAWKIWYGDGSTFSSKDGDWVDAPQKNIQMVTVFYDKTYKIYNPESKEWEIENYCDQLSGQDYYWKTAEGEFNAGAAKFVPENLPQGVVKLGQWMNDTDWLSMYNIIAQKRKIDF